MKKVKKELGDKVKLYLFHPNYIEFVLIERKGGEILINKVNLLFLIVLKGHLI